jgi:hypothetical protein
VGLGRLAAREVLTDGNLARCRATASLCPMTGRRVLPLLLGLWAVSASAQAVVTATASIALDGGGNGFARAYVVTGGGPTEYAMANTGGGAIQVYQVGSNTPGASLPGQFDTFAVADNVVVGTGAGAFTTTLVVAVDVGSAPCLSTLCLAVFFWDPVGGFVPQISISTNVSGATAMTLDATASTNAGPIHIFFTAAPTTLYRQELVLTATSVAAVGITTGIVPLVGNTNIQGMTVNGAAGILYVSDSASNITTYPEDGGSGTLYSSPGASGYSAAEGLFYYPFPLISDAGPGSPYLLTGAGQGGVNALNPGATPGATIFIGSVEVLTADAGRLTRPSAASVDATASVTLVTEDRVTAEAGNYPWLHLIVGDNLFPDGGATDGGSAADGGGGGIPTIPIIAPGPGALPGPTNSCNCSSAGSAPALLALLLPLLLARRRR